jgi:hypothetical protein
MAAKLRWNKNETLLSIILVEDLIATNQKVLFLPDLNV